MRRSPTSASTYHSSHPASSRTAPACSSHSPRRAAALGHVLPTVDGSGAQSTLRRRDVLRLSRSGRCRRARLGRAARTEELPSRRHHQGLRRPRCRHRLDADHGCGRLDAAAAVTLALSRTAAEWASGPPPAAGPCSAASVAPPALPHTQTITFNPIPDRTTADGDFNPNAHASSGLLSHTPPAAAAPCVTALSTCSPPACAGSPHTRTATTTSTRLGLCCRSLRSPRCDAVALPPSTVAGSSACTTARQRSIVATTSSSTKAKAIARVHKNASVVDQGLYSSRHHHRATHRSLRFCVTLPTHPRPHATTSSHTSNSSHPTTPRVPRVDAEETNPLTPSPAIPSTPLSPASIDDLQLHPTVSIFPRSTTIELTPIIGTVPLTHSLTRLFGLLTGNLIQADTRPRQLPAGGRRPDWTHEGRST